MAGTVGGVSCSFVKGFVRGNRHRVLTWDVPGIDGLGRQRVGVAPSRSQIIVIAYSTAGGVASWYRSLEALAAAYNSVSITNDLGDSYTVLIDDVSELRVSPAEFEGGVRGECSLSVIGV